MTRPSRLEVVAGLLVTSEPSVTTVVGADTGEAWAGGLNTSPEKGRGLAQDTGWGTSSPPENAHSFLYVAGSADPGAPLLPLLAKRKIQCVGPGITHQPGKASNQRGSRRMFSVYLLTVKVIAMSQKGDYFYESRALWLFSPPEIIWKIPL